MKIWYEHMVLKKPGYMKLVSKIKSLDFPPIFLKGQTISKANYGLLKSPKKRTKSTQNSICLYSDITIVFSFFNFQKGTFGVKEQF